MHVTVTQEEAEELLSQGLRENFENPHLVLSAPTIDELRLAIEAGIDSEVSVVVTDGQSFQDLTVKKGKVRVRSKLSFKELTLTQLRDLVVHDYGYSFEGAVLEVQPEAESSVGPIKAYSYRYYKIEITKVGIKRLTLRTYSRVSVGDGYTRRGDGLIDITDY